MPSIAGVTLSNLVKQKNIPVPIFFCDVKVIVADKITDTQRYFPKDKVEDWYGAFVYRSSPRNYIAVFQKGQTDPSLIVHECVHIVNFIMKDCGIKSDLNNDETQAYLTAWIFEKISTFVKTK